MNAVIINGIKFECLSFSTFERTSIEINNTPKNYEIIKTFNSGIEYVIQGVFKDEVIIENTYYFLNYKVNYTTNIIFLIFK